MTLWILGSRLGGIEPATAALLGLSLLSLIGVTIGVAFLELGALNNIVALTIAVTKATLVILYFMHAKESSRLIKLAIPSAFVWLLILITFTLYDFGTRGAIGVPGKLPAAATTRTPAARARTQAVFMTSAGSKSPPAL